MVPLNFSSCDVRITVSNIRNLGIHRFLMLLTTILKKGLSRIEQAVDQQKKYSDVSLFFFSMNQILFNEKENAFIL